VTTLRYWAAARAAAGVAEERTSATTLAEALLLARAVRDDRFGAVLGVCSYVVDGEPVGARDHAEVVLAPDGLVDVLPPFAGG
jgi:sulfur-carrier protein